MALASRRCVHGTQVTTAFTRRGEGPPLLLLHRWLLMFIRALALALAENTAVAGRLIGNRIVAVHVVSAQALPTTAPVTGAGALAVAGDLDLARRFVQLFPLPPKVELSR